MRLCWDWLCMSFHRNFLSPGNGLGFSFGFNGLATTCFHFFNGLATFSWGLSLSNSFLLKRFSDNLMGFRSLAPFLAHSLKPSLIDFFSGSHELFKVLIIHKHLSVHVIYGI